jgi:hypothetical protein
MRSGEGVCSVKAGTADAGAEQIYRPSEYLDILDGYFFVGITSTNGSVPMRDPDPDITFNKLAITSIIIARFLNGPLGPFDYVRPFICISFSCFSPDPAFCDVGP